MEKEYLRDIEVAQMLSIGRSTVWYLLKKGVLPHPIKISSRVTVWHREEILSYINKRSNY